VSLRLYRQIKLRRSENMTLRNSVIP